MHYSGATNRMSCVVFADELVYKEAKSFIALPQERAVSSADRALALHSTVLNARLILLPRE